MKLLIRQIYRKEINTIILSDSNVSKPNVAECILADFAILLLLIIPKKPLRKK